ncbi:hypothetical protein [Clostridium felsineum]|uniref:Uncharacterized protein n=1 Tax=Clostridium felsineum TaxID=36839 RepID=A0A1S8LWX9_9CLOT|nr:hypothetical protein [Clostridium felsineum]MCR3761496.1 hypothetical protein [Clostridium felsineum]URZ03306.1 hypothetical protein CLAUR_033520 [Clostridium felsineum]URZ08360.1 hypothetical protein CLROS_037420 [Clostridium felsineum]URZ13391.1 hypothetical protein CROST_041570 [Clostridium felsineum]URZ14633.1 hypothetical protein CLFE_006300 [Clostridium felsineum DSM 794]
MKVSIGQVIEFKTDHYISLGVGGKLLIKKGDRARVVKKIDNITGEVVYLTGEAAGKCQQLMLEVNDDLDADAIAKKIMKELNGD